MSTRTNAVQVKQVLKKIVDEVVENTKEEAELLPETSQTTSQVDDNEVRRSGRARKQPERLAPKPDAPRVIKRKKEEPPFTCEIVMDPPPADLRGILKPARRSTDPPARKSSLNATAGKAIIKKYRKVRIKRLLKFKVIPPLPGWREDRTRMPDDEVDEEEQQRLEEQNQQMQLEEAQRKKKKKRKSIGVTSVRSESEDDSVAGGASVREEMAANSDMPTPKSPDVFYEAYMKVDSPDSVLTTDREDSMDGMGNRPFNERRAPLTLFPPIEESPIDFSSSCQSTVDEGDAVARPPEPPLVDAAASKNRRRSVRIKAPEEEKKTVEKPRERRKSGMFPVTPLKEESLVVKTVEKTAVRRRSGVIRSLKKDEGREKEEEEAPTARIPWTDEPCRSEVQKAVDQVDYRKRKSAKVTAWLSRSDTVFDAGSSSANESGDKVSDRQWDKEAEEVELARGSASNESQLSERNDGGRVEETTVKPDAAQAAKRKGRRSMKFPPKEVGENEEPVSKCSKSSKSGSTSKSGSSGEEKKKPAHPFFAQFAPKPSPTAVAATATPATVSAPPQPPAEKKARRRSMFVPKKPQAPSRKDSEDSSAGSDDVVEIVAEVTKAKRSRDENESALPSPAASSTTTASAWRPLSSSEMDAAPFAGLVHVGRDEVEKENEGEEEEEGDGLVKKMRRLSVQLPRLSSYAIPASLRGSETNDEPEMEPVFDEERKEGQSKRAGALAKRARELVAAEAAAQPYAWPEAMRPRRVSECVGDEEVLAAGKRWLHGWKKRLDAVCAEEEKSTKSPKTKRKKRRGGNYSDESEREDSDSDYEVRDDESRLPNPLVLSGPIGCGKSAYIRALSSEIGFSILESAPDEKRTGSNLRAKLAGAVASYRISKPAGGISSFFTAKKTVGENGEKKEEEGGKKKGRQHTLVVIEHIDVVFAEEDKLFWPALAEILTTTKIPIVLTCNAVPDELGRILEQVEAAGAAEPMEMVMERGGGRVEEYVEASLTGSIGRPLSTTVIPALAARARADLRAALHDAHWAAAAGVISKADLRDSSTRRVDEPSVCDAVAAQPFAWTDECTRRRDAMSDSELCRAGEWPARCDMPSDAYARLCKQIDEIDQDAVRLGEAKAARAMEMARSGVSAGSGPRASLVTRREIALDWMPVLEQMDRTEQEKRRVKGRRHQHYFNVIKDLETGASIDPLDRIKGACAFFRLP